MDKTALPSDAISGLTDGYRAALPSPESLTLARSRYGLDIDARLLGPAPAGGDLWGFLPVDPHRLAVYVADFCGHGMSAAPHAIYLSRLIRSAQCPIDDPAAVLRWLNSHMLSYLPRGGFLAINYAIIDLANDSIVVSTSSSQGIVVHDPESGACEISDISGLPLGFVEDATFETRQYVFRPGAFLTAYTDALIETPLPPDNHLNPRDIANIIASCATGRTAREVNDNILAPIDHGKEELQDDLTLVTLRRE